ncbi:MAG: hypothetical protein AAGI44_00310 [Pseudomonadota bacterium]
MAQKIATVSTVFAACDRLDAANERWNREDVRNEVGGGGYVVIDPLIRAWRNLKPLREAAPTTPTELLHQVALTLETHITDFTDDIEGRLRDSQKVFESTVSDLSEKLAALEAELSARNEALQEAEASYEVTTERLEETKNELSSAQSENALLETKNDELSGQLTRLQKEHNVQVQRLQSENKTLLKQHATERARLSDEQVSAMASQRKELTDAAAQAENRLMVLLDRERQEAKAIESSLSDNLERAKQKAQSGRETIITLETSVTQLTRQNEKLESELTAGGKNNAELQSLLEKQKAATTAIEQEFTDYKRQHVLGSELGALQDAVAGLKAQIVKSKKEENQ